MLLATIDASIMLIAMPDVFRGIHLDPLRPETSFYLLWMILGYLVVTSVLVVGLGRLGQKTAVSRQIPQDVAQGAAHLAYRHLGSGGV